MEAGERAGRAIGEFLGWWPYMLHPDDLLRFVYGHDSVWTDFEDVMGYTPVRVQTPDGPRMINPEGSCSTPSLPVIGQAPPGDTGRSFDFTNACLAHDYAYDLMRFYDELGIPHDPEARRAADTLFESDMHAHCATRSGFDREACDSWATTYAAAVFLNSDRQGFGVP